MMNMHLVVPERPPAPVIEIGDIQRALAVATDPFEIKEIGAKLDAFEQYMHDCGLYSIEDMRPINETRMAARWKLGRALAQVERGTGPGRGKKVSDDQTSFRNLLRKLDLDKSLAMDAQRIGCMPDEEMARLFEQWRHRDTLLHYSDLIAFSRPYWAKVRREKRKGAYAASVMDGCTVATLGELIVAGRQFGTIYADPPWLYDNQGTRGSTDNHYEGMTVDEICALPVGQLAADDAHLHLWTTNGFLFQCPKIFEAWGFEFKSSFIWVKPQIGMGNYWRNAHEILLTAVRGDAKSFKDKNLRSWIECKRGKHSSKPEQVRHFLERASDDPRRLELFGRASAPGWVVWGNQIGRTLFDKSLEEADA